VCSRTEQALLQQLLSNGTVASTLLLEVFLSRALPSLGIELNDLDHLLELWELLGAELRPQESGVLRDSTISSLDLTSNLKGAGTTRASSHLGRVPEVFIQLTLESLVLALVTSHAAVLHIEEESGIAASGSRGRGDRSHPVRTRERRQTTTK